MNFHNLNQEGWQSLIYLLVLLAVILGTRKNDLPWKKVLQYLAIWSAIGLLVVIVYSYRFEFSDLKHRILSEINPSAAKTNNAGELQISMAQDGHFYLDAQINGHDIRFMVDTGASDIVISLSDAKRLGIDAKKLTFNRPYQTANGKSWGAIVTLDEFVVGDVVFLHDVNVSVNNADMGTALLGMSFLRRFSKYEFARDRLILTL